MPYQLARTGWLQHRDPPITDPVPLAAVVEVRTRYMVGNGATVEASREWAERLLADL